MGILVKVKELKEYYHLQQEFKHSKYAFSMRERELGIRLRFHGYRGGVREELLSIENCIAHIRVGNCELWVPEHAFKPGELSWLYSEIFTPIEDNPHTYETEKLHIEKDDIVLDVGSCEGFFIKYALDRGAKTVFAFEPLKALTYGLQKTYEKELKNQQVKIVHKGLSDKEGLVKFDSGQDFICEAKMNRDGSEDCEVSTLDHLVDTGEIPRVDFLKMDIEGAELLALKGAEAIIKNQKPKLSIAVYHDYENANMVKDLLLAYRPDYTVEFGGCFTFEKPFRPYMVYAW